MPLEMRSLFLKIQNDLFDLGGALALPTQGIVSINKITWLDEQIALYNADLPPLREFILPGGTRAGALCHVARTVVRRAERDLVALSKAEPLPQHALQYMNRLSDLLFVMSRCINRQQAEPETFWQAEK